MNKISLITVLYTFRILRGDQCSVEAITGLGVADHDLFVKEFQVLVFCPIYQLLFFVLPAMQVSIGTHFSCYFEFLRN